MGDDLSWIEEGLEKPGKTKTGLATALGRSPSAVTALLAGRRALKAREIEIVAAYLGVEPPSQRSVEVPLLSWVSAGAMMRDDVADEALGIITVSDLPPGDWIALRVVGDSMDRISPPESTIFVDRRDRRLVPNGLYVIADEEGHATYKRFRPDPMRFEPVSVNPAHEPLYPVAEPQIVGRVKRTTLDT